MNNFAILLNDVLFYQYNIEVDVFFSKRKSLHIGFKNPFSTYPFLSEMIGFIKFLWKDAVNNAFDYEMVFSILTGERGMFYFVFF